MHKEGWLSKGKIMELMLKVMRIVNRYQENRLGHLELQDIRLNVWTLEHI